MARPRQESVIEMDAEFIRPRFTLVFSLTAIFLLIGLNVLFWYPYVKVIIWAIAASQLIRPLTDEFVRAAEKLHKERIKSKRNILLVFHDVIIMRGNAKSDVENVGTEPASNKNGNRYLGFAAFMFNNPTPFLMVAVCFHLMPIHIFLMWSLTLTILGIVLSVLSDISGLTDLTLRSIMRPEIVSTLLITALIVTYIVLDGTLLVSAFFEVADLVSWLSSSLSVFLEAMSKDSKAAVVSNLPRDIAWVQDHALRVYDYSSKEFGQRKWWAVVETLRESFEHGEPAEVMARSALTQIRTVYNDTEWLGIVEIAIMSAVPEHRSLHPEGVSIYQLIVNTSWKSLWLSFGETMLKFSAFFKDLLRLLSDVAGQILVFLFILQKLCKSSRDVITCICIFTVPASNKARTRLNNSLREAIQGAFTEPATMAHKSALVVLLVYGVLGLPGAFISTCFVYILSGLHVFPEVPTLLACSLPLISYQFVRVYLSNEWTNPWLWFDLIRALFLPILLIEVSYFANFSRRHVHEKSSAVSPWLTDFSLAVGISQFGIDGLILGPFLAAVSFVVLNFVLQIAEQDLVMDDLIIANHAAKRMTGLTRTESMNGHHAQEQPNFENVHEEGLKESSSAFSDSLPHANGAGSLPSTPLTTHARQRFEGLNSVQDNAQTPETHESGRRASIASESSSVTSKNSRGVISRKIKV